MVLMSTGPTDCTKSMAMLYGSTPTELSYAGAKAWKDIYGHPYHGSGPWQETALLRPSEGSQ